MKGILMLLKSIGVEITPEQIALLQQYIPQIPALCNGAATAINGAIQNFDLRLKAIEAEQKSQRELLEEIYAGTEQPVSYTPGGTPRYTDPRRRRVTNGLDTKPGDGGTTG